MASKARAQAKAEERAERLAELRAQEKARERRRNVQVGAVAVVVLLLLVGVFYLVSQRGGPDTDGVAAAGQSGYGVTIGSEDAPHKVVIYEDFLCPFCGQLEGQTRERLQQLADDGEVFVDYRPFVLLDAEQFDDYSPRAVSAFGVVRDEAGDEVAKRFHDLLFENQPEETASSFPDADALVDLAVQAGADEAAVRPGIEAGVSDYAQGATDEAQEARVQSTPTVIVDGEALANPTADALLGAIGQ
ncbi:mycothiol-dependent reductase [Nocardioides marinquilinus]|uniref:Mycothiol-dependent reductase n=1 Tax=Nocardioides marinquilinus TaxID=1210400 RepID=A0ABP9Q3D0_9ACTN